MHFVQQKVTFSHAWKADYKLEQARCSMGTEGTHEFCPRGECIFKTRAIGVM